MVGLNYKENGNILVTEWKKGFKVLQYELLLKPADVVSCDSISVYISCVMMVVQHISLYIHMLEQI